MNMSRGIFRQFKRIEFPQQWVVSLLVLVVVVVVEVYLTLLVRTLNSILCTRNEGSDKLR